MYNIQKILLGIEMLGKGQLIYSNYNLQYSGFVIVLFHLYLTRNEKKSFRNITVSVIEAMEGYTRYLRKELSRFVILHLTFNYVTV